MKKTSYLKKEKLVGRKSSRLFLFGIMFFAIALALMLPKNVNAATISVPDDFPTIQQAIDAAGTGDLVYVQTGTYYEHVTINKSLTLQGEDRETTIIDGSGSGAVVYITANYVTISGLTATNGESGISLINNWSVNHITIDNVIITSNEIGFYAIHSGGYHLIEHCIFSYNGRVSYAHQFGNSIIRNCDVFGNDGALSVAWGSNTLITNNEIHHNNATGLHFDSMFNSFIENNNVHHNSIGISAGFVASNNIIRENRVHDNEKGIVFGVHSAVSNNKVFHNDIYDNIVHAWDRSGNNIWDNGYPSGGNYWSDYTGEDLDNDGIGDTPYIFDGNQDNYPLIQPLFNSPPVALCQDVAVSADENCEAIVTAGQVDNGSYDPDGDPITLSLDPPGPYQLGTTPVTLTVEDDSGETDQCTATITVVDNTSPVADADPLPDLFGECSVTITAAPTATDNCTGTITGTTTDPLSYTTQGTFTVTWTYDDRNGNIASQNQIIVVDDITAPDMITIGEPLVMWPPNHEYKTFDMYDFITSVTDNCTDLSIGDVYFKSASSDEPEDANGGGDGNTLDDIVLADDCKSIKLRKERQGNGNGRYYTVYLEVNDGHDNYTEVIVHVTVPLNPGNDAVNDDAVYWELTPCNEYNKSAFISAKNTNEEFELINYPNPFNGKTTIAFTVYKTNKTTIKVYSALGEKVATIFDKEAIEGNEYTIEFDALKLPKGIYFYHLQSGKINVVKKMLFAY